MTLTDLKEIEEKLGYTFADKNILARAFTHSSYAKYANVADNERMEFLGDAILEMTVSEYLFNKYADEAEGALSTMRSNVVSAEALRPVVKRLDVVRYLQLGGGASDVVSSSKKIESNLYEAIVCAIYLDGGLDSAKAFVLRTLEDMLDSSDKVERKDSKTLLQEYCQKRKIAIPTYTLAEKSGTENNPTYKCDLYVNGKYLCSGIGHSKKSAEQDAAKKLVTEWRIDSALS